MKHLLLNSRAIEELQRDWTFSTQLLQLDIDERLFYDLTLSEQLEESFTLANERIAGKVFMLRIQYVTYYSSSENMLAKIGFILLAWICVTLNSANAADVDGVKRDLASIAAEQALDERPGLQE